jgi:serine/threonine protein kinase
MAIDLAGALHLVHASGIVHRDIKPGNVLLAPSSMPAQEFSAKLADFGIAYLVDATRLTATGILLGTAAYVSPEQALGKPPGPPTDIYALGLVLLESLTRDRAFTGSVAESLATRITADPIIPSTLGAGWHGLLTWMTSRPPEDRPTALDVVAAARAIESATTAPVDADAPTEALLERPAEQPLEPTRVMLAAGASTSATEVLRPTGQAAAETARATPPARRSSRRVLAPIVGAIGVLVLLLASVAIAVSQLPAADTPPEPSVIPELPALDDPLGRHLDELLEAING